MAALIRAGLGLLVGAISYVPTASAQVPPRDTAVAPVPPRPDSVIGDSTARRRRAQADTIERVVAPLLQAELPPLPEIGGRLRFDRQALAASGALTLADLVERVPGMVAVRARWFTAPMAGAYLGDPAAVRVFLDGVELETLDARNNGVPDLTTFQLWTLEEVAVERGASEVRIHMRTWRGDTRTSAVTRVDVTTGDEDTNFYRGYFARRFGGGLAMQAGGQQYNTEAPRYGGDGDALSLVARFGYATGPFSVDAYINRTRRTRNELVPSEDPRVAVADAATIPPLDATDQEAYVRVGAGDPERGLWIQGVAATRRFIEVGGLVDSSTANSTGAPLNIVDTTVSQAQYVTAAGFSRGGLRASVTNRLRVFGGERFTSPSARLAFDRPRVSVSLYGEDNSVDERTRVEGLVRLLPTSFVAITGAVSQIGEGPTLIVSDGDSGTVALARPSTRAARAELALRLGRLWMGGGMLLRDSAVLRAPTVFDRALVTIPDVRATGALVTLHGRIYKDVGVEAHGVRWDDADTFYRPQFQSRARLYLATDWLRKFPNRTFSLYAGIQHDYRSKVFYPYADGVKSATQNRVLSSQIEVRIVDATIFWHFRNILGTRYSQVPGLEMPRPLGVYGVRWSFRN